jgi:DNA-binding transcriptional ArsR family regulator
MNKISCDCNIIHKEAVYNTKKMLEEIKIFNDVSNFFKIIGDNTRIKILFSLDNNEMCVCDIANTLEMSKSSISHQLSILKENGIIKSRRSGKEVYYTLDDEHVSEVFEVALEHIKHKKGELNEKI